MKMAMKTPYKGYSIITSATTSAFRSGWHLTLEILNADQERVVGPIPFEDFVFAHESAAHEAGVVAARSWIDGENSGKKAA